MFVDQQKSPNDAKSFCETKLGRLFEPRSASTNKLVYDKGNDLLPGNRDSRWWIGVVTYNGKSGPWQFASSGEKLQTSMWYSGQPNESVDEIWTYFGSDCGNEKWCDASTSGRYSFICEFV